MVSGLDEVCRQALVHCENKSYWPIRRLMDSSITTLNVCLQQIDKADRLTGAAATCDPAHHREPRTCETFFVRRLNLISETGHYALPLAATIQFLIDLCEQIGACSSRTVEKFRKAVVCISKMAKEIRILCCIIQNYCKPSFGARLAYSHPDCLAGWKICTQHAVNMLPA